MNYAEIKEFDIANGPGIRLSLFVSGCSHHCRGCFNAIAQDPSYGEPWTAEVQEHILNLIETDKDTYQGITLLGGEPMEPYNQKELLPFVREFRKRFPDKDVWCFTGYLFDEDILGRMVREIPETGELLSLFNVVVDGEYVESLKDITLLYKGSSNQRTIDVQKSLAEHRIIQWDPKGVSMSKTSHL
jgi:anaerobic ribonucleoside-triphosphate reductase activating protein